MIITSDNISCTHAFSTRIGGVSSGIYASLNLGLNTGDEPENVIRNWKIFSEAAGFGTEKFVYGLQVHSNNVVTASAEDARGICEGPLDRYRADGYVTDRKGVPLVVFTADCVPLLMEDPKAGVIAAVHCGWRSTAADIEKRAVEAMRELGARPEQIYAAIGPAIEQSCFETGPEVAEAMERLLGRGLGALMIMKKNGKCMLDLKGIVKERLRMLGVPEGNVSYAGGCTMCEPERFWSHRYIKGPRGSQANVIML